MKWYLVFLTILIIAPATVQPAGQPNIILIVADDMRADDIEYMPQVQSLLVGQGAVFTNYFVTQSLCCPSRVSILTGMYPHNHGITGNKLPNGGFQKFRNSGLENSTLAVWLQGAGYTTAYIGKYLNGCKYTNDCVTPSAGWDTWMVSCRGHYYHKHLSLCENGSVVDYGKGIYETDLLSLKATGFISTTTQPFFTIVAVYTPHMTKDGPPRPANRHKDTFNGVAVPRTEAFNEADVSDKPSWIAGNPLLTQTQIAFIDDVYEGRLEALQAVDDLVEDVMETLEATGRLTSTIIIFTSDNGFQLGEHRITPRKNLIYEESIRVPLVIRGPGVVPGVYDHLTANIDLAPTIAQWAGAAVPASVDGRLLSDTTRTGLLIETFPPGSNQPDRFHAIRTACGVYAEYANGERERYLMTDTLQINSLPGDGGLTASLEALQVCSGDCRQMENEVDICH